MAERYAVEKRVLGEGSFGTVYKGYEIATGNEIAVKEFKSRDDGVRFLKKNRNNKSRESYLQESNNLQNLEQHDNIVRMIAAYTRSSSSYIVMELCDGQDLGKYMRQLQNVYGVQVEDFQAILLDVTAGYRHLVQHDMAHRDIKPDNIMRCRQRNGAVVYKLSDLGTAKIYSAELAAEQQTDTGGMMSFVGTPMFMDPYLIARKHIQRKELEAYSNLVDLWSLGITFYTLLCNCQPFNSKDDTDFVMMIRGKPEAAIVGYCTDKVGEYGYSSEFRNTSPVQQMCSSKLKDIYKAVLVECFKQYKNRSMDAFFARVESIRSQELCFELDVKRSIGNYSMLNCDSTRTLFRPYTIQTSHTEDTIISRDKIVFALSAGEIKAEIPALRLLKEPKDGFSTNRALTVSRYCERIYSMYYHTQLLQEKIVALQKLAVDILERRQCEELEGSVPSLESYYSEIITGYYKCKDVYMEDKVQNPSSNLVQAKNKYLVNLHGGVQEELKKYQSQNRLYIEKLCGMLGKKLSPPNVLVACNSYTFVNRGRCESPDSFYTGKFNASDHEF